MSNLNTPQSKGLLERLDLFCKETGIIKKKVVELALKKYLEEYEKKE